ncbi:FAD-dependent oxidoreductase [Ramlibacter sp.]|uniref:FAD-dependent oxidoreductase n=1 Tax=Ramlibacter sp. TaxID=1917967 RepID=UPI003D109B59
MLPLDVCIRGAGVVGRTLALLLARDGLRVGLVDASPAAASGASDVRAYAMNAASKTMLETVRAWPDAAHATPVLAMHVRGDAGGEVTFNAGAEGAAALAWIVDVAPLLERLGEALRYQPFVERIPKPQAAPLTVVCEGRASATRDEFGVNYEVTSYRQTAIAARVQCERPHGQTAHQWFDGGDVLALLPLGGATGHEAALVWSLGEARAGELLALGAPEFESRLQAASHDALGKLTLSTERAAWPLQLAKADRWCGPGWALAGDAAHNVHPLAGQGLNLGLADAALLAQVLRERESWRSPGDTRLLRRYERSRKADVMAMSAATDGLQQLFSQASAPWAWLRNRGMNGFEMSGPVKHWVARQAMGRL